MSNEELAKKIVDLLGGKDNILNAENCMTRIRVNVKDGSKADRQGIKNTPGVSLGTGRGQLDITEEYLKEWPGDKRRGWETDGILPPPQV